jgi:hypothetical protein
MVQLLDLHTAAFTVMTLYSLVDEFRHFQRNKLLPSSGRNDIHFYPENRCTIFLCNNGTDLPEYNTMS